MLLSCQISDLGAFFKSSRIFWLGDLKGKFPLLIRRCSNIDGGRKIAPRWSMIYWSLCGLSLIARFCNLRRNIFLRREISPSIAMADPQTSIETLKDVATMGVQILTYTDHYFDGVDALWHEAFPSDQPRNEAKVVIPSKLAFQPDLLLVGVENDCVVGSVMAGYDGHRGWINRIAVLKSHRSRGVGRALVREAEARLQAIGCTKINLQVVTSNAAATEFYRRLGYSIEERISMSKKFERS
jgi:ribosomal protein S18 acetylase RimI-like enzyme